MTHVQAEESVSESESESESEESHRSRAPEWWRDSVIYQVYIRSFADGNSDGVGDIPGLTSRLPYLSDLGVDGIWINPWYPSPMRDGGYDVTDYRDIDPLFGTVDDAAAMLATAHGHGLRVILDLVANHTSNGHPWFAEALASAAGSPERERYFFRDGRGTSGNEPPNNWISAFGGRAWTRTTTADGQPGQWYLHIFAPEQPDLNWANPEVAEAFDDVLRFWFDLGVDGFRVDAAPAMAKVPGLPDAGYGPGALFASTEWVDNPHWDVDAVHDVLRRWRRVGDEYDDRVFVTEAVVNGAERMSRYVRPDEMHTTFNFDFLRAPWDSQTLRQVIDDSLAALRAVAAPATWVLSTHDEVRHVTRYGRANTGAVLAAPGPPTLTDLSLGTRRARAAALLLLALPGVAYIYQGDELGLPEVEDLPEDVLADPMWERSGHTVRGRDGCRVPLPWAGDAPPFDFTTGPSAWLPQPADWRRLTVAAEEGDAESMLHLYRTALRLRRERGPVPAELEWLAAPPDALAFQRADGLRCVVNFAESPMPMAAFGSVILASQPIVDALLPRDAAAWLVAD